MSSPTKDTNPAENEVHPPSDLNIDDEVPVASTAAPDTTLTAASTETAAKKLGSPQASVEDPFHEEENDNDLEVHPIVPFSSHPAEDTVVTATTTPAAAPPASTTPTIATPPATPAHAPATPASEREAKLAILTEAFPDVEKEVCEFVLESHRGNVEASINALLEISDPEFQPEPQQDAPPAVAAAPPAHTPPALPRRQDPDDLSQGVADINFGQNQPRAEIDPILLASTSTSEQQLRADEDFARTLAAMDEYRARDRQNVRNQQNQQQQQHEEDESPSFATEIKELMDEELPKIKERFNVAADTTKKKVTEWYNTFKASRAESAQRNANQGQHGDSSRHQSASDNRDPIRFGSRVEEDEPLARHRVTPPLHSGATPPLPVRPYDLDGAATLTTSTEPVTTSLNSRRTTLEDDIDVAMNNQPVVPSRR